MGMILTMSVSGSIIILFYILLKPLAARYFSAKWTYGLLKTAMVFYLFSFPYWNSYYIDFFCFLLKKERELSTLSMEQSIDLYAEKMIEYYPDGSIHIIAPITTWLILGIWIFIALCFFIFGLRHYCMQKKMLLLSSIVMADIRELTFTNEIKQKQHILRKVLLKQICKKPCYHGNYKSDYCSSREHTDVWWRKRAGICSWIYSYKTLGYFVQSNLFCRHSPPLV